jgi:hypothetical protein
MHAAEYKITEVLIFSQEDAALCLRPHHGLSVLPAGIDCEPATARL